MKNLARKSLMIALVVMGTALFNNLHADPPPPPAGGEHGQTGNQTGGGAAPLAGGSALLLGMAAGYAVRKKWAQRQAGKE